MPDAALVVCETLRKADYDRYLAAMMAPARSRASLFALYAFNYEVAKTAESVREPIAAAIRLQWWREAVEKLRAGETTPNPVLALLGKAIAAHDLPRGLFAVLIDARDHDLEETPFADWAAFEAYADATSGNVMRLAARILGAGGTLDEAARHAGIAYALAGLLRALPFHAARRRLMVPLDAMKRAGLSAEEIFAGVDDARVAHLRADLAKEASAHWRVVRHAVPRRFLPALLPASVVPLYVKAVTKPGFDLFRDTAEVPVHRRQLAMMAAMIFAGTFELFGGGFPCRP